MKNKLIFYLSDRCFKFIRRHIYWYWQRLFLIFFLGAFLSAIALPAIANYSIANQQSNPNPPALSTTRSTTNQTLEYQAQQQYNAGQFTTSIATLQQALQEYRGKGDLPGQALILSNLVLNYQQLNDWKQANQAMEQAVELFQQTPQPKNHLNIWAQVLDVQGSLYLSQGKAEAALQIWQKATRLYNQAGETNRAVLSEINQAQAFMNLGMHRRALAILEQRQTNELTQITEMTQATWLKSLGEALQGVGELEKAEKSLQQSLELATRLKALEAIATTNLSLGNLMGLKGKTHIAQEQAKAAQIALKAALSFYRAAESGTPKTRAQAVLNRLHLLITTPQTLLTDLDPWTEANRLYTQLQDLIPRLPMDQPAILLQISFGQDLMSWQKAHPANAPSRTAIAQQLATTLEQAKKLNDPRLISEALGNLGSVYEQTKQWSEAQKLTQAALVQAQAIQANDIAYRWQWQLGRILCQGTQPCAANLDRKGAIAAYTSAFNTLQALRQDLVAVNADVQFSFQESIEPIYRQLVDLLLQSQGDTPPSQQDLQQARNILEALQATELQNFLKTGCHTAKSQIDHIIDHNDPTAAVIYPIILGNRLEVILKLPGTQNLYRYPPTYLAKQTITDTLTKLQTQLQEEYTFNEVKQGAQTVYDWLIRPAEAHLAAQKIKTLIFVLDGPLRTIPMAVLYDGEHYLVEKYATSLVLGLEVRNPQPLQRSTLKVLATSLTNPPKGFETLYSRLDNVNPELDQIQTVGLSGTFLRDRQFTQSHLSQALRSNHFQIVHLATHGQFGSNRENTYLLAADGAIYVDDLSQVFRNNGDQANVIELLILSACKTASGNNRAVLGIAGTTVRAGAQSAIASLWSLADAPSVRFVQALYQHLGEAQISRTEALRRAQVAVMQSQDADYSHPRFWASYVLVGSWL